MAEKRVIDPKYLPTRLNLGFVPLMWLMVDVWCDWNGIAIGIAGVLTFLMLVGLVAVKFEEQKSHPTQV